MVKQAFNFTLDFLVASEGKKHTNHPCLSKIKLSFLWIIRSFVLSGVVGAGGEGTIPHFAQEWFDH